jgi:raffinose/stachyose/melibiose transport system substrate-binding protein
MREDLMSNTVQGSLTRRRFLTLAGAAGVTALGAACAGPGSSSSQSSAPAAPSTSGPVEGQLSFAHWRAEDQQVFADVIKRFAASNGDVEVRQDISPANDYQSSALQRLRSGNVGDVFPAFRGAQFSDMVDAGLFTDLSDHPASSALLSEYAEVGQHEGTQLGIPYQVVFLMPIYNVDLFDEQGISEVPKDWDGFLSMCDQLKSGGVVPIAWPGGEPGNAAQFFNSMVMNNAPSDDMCAKIEAGEYKLTDDWFLRTLEQYAELRPFMQPNAAGTQPEPLQQMFAAGDAAMLATGSYHIVAARDLGADFTIDVLSPITTTAEEAKYVGVHNATFILGVNAESEIQPAASAFLEHLTDPEIASVYANGTAQHVPLEGVEYTNPDLQRLEAWLDRETILAPRYQFMDLDVAEAVQNTGIKVISGTSPEQAAEEAQEIVDQQL